MIIDAMPHVLSMLSTLTGPGLPENIMCQKNLNQMLITFDYHHVYQTKVTCRFIQTSEQPRPAKYSINDLAVERYLDMKNYQIYLQNHQQKIKIEDPLFLLVKNYISHVNQNLAINNHKLISEMESLSILYENI